MKIFLLSIAAVLASFSHARAQEQNLGPKGDPEKIIASLLKNLEQKEEPGLRLQATIDLAEFGPLASKAVPALMDALLTNDEDLRLNSAIALGRIGKPAVAALSEALASKDDDTRFYAVWALGWIGPEGKSAAPAVIRALRDKNEGVRRKAAYTLGRIGAEPAKAIAGLIESLGDANEDVRQAAAEGVSKYGELAVKPLIVVLESGKATERRSAAHALGQIGADAKEAVPALKKLLLSHEHKEGVDQIAEALAGIGKASIPALNEALKDDRSEVRVHAINALGKIAGEAVPFLVDALSDKHVDVRRQAAQVLAPMRVGDKMVVLGLAYALKDEDETVRMHVLNGLAQLGPAAKLAAPHLTIALADLNFNVRQQAFWVLQNMGVNPREPLLKALDSKDDRIRINTASLMMVMGVDQNTALPVLTEALKHKNNDLQMQAAHALAQTRRETEKVVPILIEGLKSTSVGVKQQALQSLQNMGELAKVAAPAILDVLHDADANVRQQAIYTLQNVRGDPEKIVPALAKLMKDEKVEIRQQIIQILWQVGGAKSVPVIVEAMRDKDDNVRQQAIWGLQNVQGDIKAALPSVRPLLKDANAQIRHSALIVLGRMGNDAAPDLLEALKDKDGQVRLLAANGLRQLGGKHRERAMEAYKELLKEGNANVRQQVIYSLHNHAEGVELLLKTYPDADDQSKGIILSALIYTQWRDKAVPLVKEGLKDKSPQVRLTSAQLLANVGIQSKEAVEAVASILREKDKQMRIQALHALGNYGQLGWPAYEEALKDAKDDNFRSVLLQMMSNTGFRAKNAVPNLIPLLKDKSSQNRLLTAHILGNHLEDARPALPALREALNDTDANVRNHAQNAISRIPEEKKD